MVSYLIDPMFHGKGYGKIILEYGIDRVRFSKKKVKKIFGLVQQENTPSIKIFQKLGFQNTSRENRSLKYEKEFSKWK